MNQLIHNDSKFELRIFGGKVVHKVELAEVIEAHELIKQVNKLELEKIEFYFQGNKLELKPESIDLLKNWQYIGLNNLDFIKEVWHGPGFKRVD